MKRTAFKRKTTTKKTHIKRGLKTPGKLKKHLDALFSQYIRLKFSQDGGARCYTCGKFGSIKNLQCGHFVSRQYLATRWHEDNCRPQCVGCNMWGRGQLLDFEENLIKELGKEKVELLKASRHQMLKLDVNWYQQNIKLYRLKIEELNKQV